MQQEWTRYIRLYIRSLAKYKDLYIGPLRNVQGALCMRNKYQTTFVFINTFLFSCILFIITFFSFRFFLFSSKVSLEMLRLAKGTLYKQNRCILNYYQAINYQMTAITNLSILHHWLTSYQIHHCMDTIKQFSYDIAIQHMHDLKVHATYQYMYISQDFFFSLFLSNYRASLSIHIQICTPCVSWNMCVCVHL